MYIKKSENKYDETIHYEDKKELFEEEKEGFKVKKQHPLVGKRVRVGPLTHEQLERDGDRFQKAEVYVDTLTGAIGILMVDEPPMAYKIEKE